MARPFGSCTVTHPEIGTRYSRLTFLGEQYFEKERWYYRVRCDCGKELYSRRDGLLSGHAESCGCINKERVRVANVKRCTTHGERTRGNSTAEYKIWKSIVNRATNTSSDAYKHYAKRGIGVCQRWRDSYEAFLSDMGRRPSPQHTIERKNNDGDYEPENCVWLHRSEQCYNKRNTRFIQFCGQKVSLIKLGREFGLNLVKVPIPAAINRIQIRLFEQELARS